MKKLLLILFAGCVAAQAQNKISGMVTGTDMQPLEGVSVFAPEIHKGTITDDSGRYTISNLPAGKLTITFTAVGYNAAQHSVEVRGETVLNVTLEQALHQMDEVVVLTAFNKFQTQNVMKVDHVKLNSLTQRGAVTLAEGMSAVPGVSQISTGVSIGKPVIRGLSGNRVVAYTQGVRLENQQFGDEHGLGLSDNGTESVEIVKGPASLLYGPDAIGGVMYFNPEKFADAGKFNVNIGQRLMSNTLGSASYLGLKSSTEDWKFSVRGSHATHSDYQVPSGKRVTNTRFNESDIKTAIGFSHSGYSGILRYNGNFMNTGIPEGIDTQSASKKPSDPQQKIANHLFSLRNNFIFGKSSLEATLGYSLNDRDELEDGETALSMKLNTISYNVIYKFPSSEKFEIHAGLQGMSQRNRNYGHEMLIPDANTDDFGIFSKFDFNLEKHTFQAGIRFDNRHIQTQSAGFPGEEGYFQAIDRQFSSLNAAIGYKTNFSSWRIRFNMASGFRSPNLSELTSNGVHEGTNRYEIGNADLKNEQALQADLRIEYKLGHWEFFANGFANRIGNYIYLSPTDETIDEHQVFEYLQDDAMLYGGEAGLHFHPHPLDFLHLESTFETVAGKRDNGGYLPLIPANNWTNTLRAETNQLKWIKDAYARVDVHTFFDQRNVSVFETKTGGYTIFNLGIGGNITWRKSKLFVSLNGNNLFNRRYISHLSRLKQDNIPDMGRNIIMSVDFSF